MAKARNARTTKESINYGYDSTFPEILRRLLEGTTQDSLATHCGVARQSVAQWKDGKTKPDIYYLEKIADFFNVPTDYLLGRTKTTYPDTDIQSFCNRYGFSDNFIKVLDDLLSKNYEEDTYTLIEVLEKYVSEKSFVYLISYVMLYASTLKKLSADDDYQDKIFEALYNAGLIEQNEVIISTDDIIMSRRLTCHGFSEALIDNVVRSLLGNIIPPGTILDSIYGLEENSEDKVKN